MPVEVLDFKLRLMREKGYELRESAIRTRSNYLKDFEMEKSREDFII